MRREILFRAKKETDGKWVEGLPNYCSDNGSITKFETYGPHSSGVYTVDPDTICQYTGLTDKNGHKIFENDIVRGRMHGTYGYRMYTGVVEYYRDGFKANVNPKSDFCDYKNIPDRCEVLGNVFDNPDLIIP